MTCEIESSQSVCGQCEASWQPCEPACWLCGAPSDWREKPDLGDATESTGADRRTPETVRYSLSTLFLLITLLACILGFWTATPLLSIFLGILAAPALLRTCIVVDDRQKRGQATSAQLKTITFYESALHILIGGSLAIFLSLVITFVFVGLVCLLLPLCGFVPTLLLSLYVAAMVLAGPGLFIRYLRGVWTAQARLEYDRQRLTADANQSHDQPNCQRAVVGTLASGPSGRNEIESSATSDSADVVSGMEIDSATSAPAWSAATPGANR